jgi:hypothetical protein
MEGIEQHKAVGNNQSRKKEQQRSCALMSRRRVCETIDIEDAAAFIFGGRNC